MGGCNQRQIERNTCFHCCALCKPRPLLIILLTIGVCALLHFCPCFISSVPALSTSSLSILKSLPIPSFHISPHLDLADSSLHLSVFFSHLLQVLSDNIFQFLYNNPRYQCLFERYTLLRKWILRSSTKHS